MSFFDEANQDKLYSPPEEVSAGPRLGFLENFDVAYNAEAKAASQFGIEKAMADTFDEQRQALRKVGVEGVDAGVLTNGMDIMAFYDGSGPEPKMRSLVNGETQSFRLSQYDERIAALKEKYPSLNLRTTREVSDYVKSQAVEAERRAKEARTTFMGGVGGFIGASAAGLDPRLNPLNTATMGLGAVGKTIAARIAAQAGLQGVTETINQLTGVQRERELLGLSHGFGDAAMRVGAAAAGGALAQGVGEAFVFGTKRWFSHAPNDPAPPVPPELMPGATPAPRAAIALTQEQEALFNKAFAEAHGPSRAGELRGVIDTEHVRAELDRWDGEAPVNIKPPDAEMATRFPRDVGPGFDVASPETRAVFGQSTLEDMARAADPKVFDIVDKITVKQQELRAQLDAAKPTEAQAHAAVQDLTARIEDLTDKVKNKRFTAAEREAAGGRAEAKAQAQAQIAAMTAERDTKLQSLMNSDTPEMAALRQQIVKNDERLRDHAPVLSRAYARAQGKWDMAQEYKDLVRRSVTKGTGDYFPDDAVKQIGSYEDALAASAPTTLTLEDKAPLMRRANEVAGSMRENADAVDVMRAIVAKDSEAFDQSLQSFRDGLQRMLKDETGSVTINGTDYKINMDEKIHVSVEDGTGTREMTVRQFLEDSLDNEVDLKAVQTCSL